MPDRLLRADLFESDRWLDLPSTDARLLFVYLLTVADDYGNLEDSRRLFRAARTNVLRGKATGFSYRFAGENT